MKFSFIKCRYFDKESQTFWTHVLPPDGMARLASCLLREGYHCSIYDMEPLKATNEDLRRYLEKEKPDIVGIEVQTPLFAKCQVAAKIARQVLPNALILVGGAHTFIEPKHTLKNIPEVDYVLRGECEYTLVDFLRAYNEGKRGKELPDIPGLCFRKENGYHISEKVPLVENVDEVPFGAFHLLPLDKYYDAFYPAKCLYAIVSTRGCPYSCSFCGEPLIYGRKPRARSPKNVVDEMEILVKEHGVDYISFQDATFNFNINRAKNICREILDRNLSVAWKVKARVEKVDEEMLRLMKEAGCKTIGFGVESASEQSLKFLNKGFSIEQVRNAFALARKVGIETLAYFMLGTEGETEQDLKETIQFSIDLRPTYSHYMITTPMYGSKLHEYYKTQVANVSLEKYLFFSAMVDTDKLSKETIKKYHRLAYIKFYLRPRFILEQLFHLKGFQDFWLKAKYAFFMLFKIIRE